MSTMKIKVMIEVDKEEFLSKLLPVLERANGKLLRTDNESIKTVIEELLRPFVNDLPEMAEELWEQEGASAEDALNDAFEQDIVEFEDADDE